MPGLSFYGERRCEIEPQASHAQLDWIAKTAKELGSSLGN
jgi:hypothetical protein